MTAIWREGFESGLPQTIYLDGAPFSQFYNNPSLTRVPHAPTNSISNLVSGRNAYSLFAFCFAADSNNLTQKAIYTLESSLTEIYLRAYIKLVATGSGVLYPLNEILGILIGSNFSLSLRENGNSLTAFQIYARVSGAYGSVFDVTLSNDAWIKVDMYLKVGTSGAYEVRINNIPIISANDVDMGNDGITGIQFGFNGGTLGNSPLYIYFDDMGINDTLGTKNNSWLGETTIIALKPKGAGNKTQWTTSQGYTIAEDGTTTTNIEITNHGLSTDDVIYNATRNVYRLITKVDDNNFTLTSVTGQTQGDIIIAFTYVSTITAITGTSTSKVLIPGHTLESYDVFINTTRSNAIRRVMYKNGVECINSDSNIDNGVTGLTISSQASGDIIKTFKVKQYSISDHWKAVNNSTPNPSYSNIESSTINQIDTFDMEELVTDKLLASNTKIITANIKVYAREKGTASQFQPIMRLNGADYTGNTITLIGGTVEYSSLYENSPYTETTFTLSEIDSIEVGVKVV